MRAVEKRLGANFPTLGPRHEAVERRLIYGAAAVGANSNARNEIVFNVN